MFPNIFGLNDDVDVLWASSYVVLSSLMYASFLISQSCVVSDGKSLGHYRAIGILRNQTMINLLMISPYREIGLQLLDLWLLQSLWREK